MGKKKTSAAQASPEKKKEELQQKLDEVNAQRRAAIEEQVRLARAVQAAKEADGVGPSMMAAQGSLITRLLTMAQEVEDLSGEERREERVKVSQRVEGELNDMEKLLEKQDMPAAAKQQAHALIGLVRSALQSDRDGTEVKEEEWTEENLLNKHGLVTYASADYWEQAFAANKYGESFEWYGGWDEKDKEGNSLASFLRSYLQPDAKTLVLGCGNSDVSAVMLEEGIKNVLSVDVSESVIQQMKTKYADSPGLDWKVMDVTKMDLPDGSQDLIFDKGLFDALYAGTGTLVAGALTEVVRTMSPGAHLLSVSFGGDRLASLFGVGEGSKAPEAAKLLDSQLVGTLEYAKAQGSDEGKFGKTYVYVCKRRETETS